MSGKIRCITAAFGAGLVIFGAGGCSRSIINYQIAESIGTLGEYENNEPVETPKMQAERELKEEEESAEAERLSILENSEQLAEGYWYEEAIELLESSELLEEDERALTAIRDYQNAIDSLAPYEGNIVHLNFPNLITDTGMAIDDDSYSLTYSQNLITLDEFNNILNQLYENGYVLIDIHDLAEETDDGFGDISMHSSSLMFPKDRKPLIISVENLNYSAIRNNDGIATKLVLDSDGKIAAEYTDANGIVRSGAYDVVPVLEQFIEDHSDFSYQGARGIIGLSGKYGAFGYLIEEDSDAAWESNARTVTDIADRLRLDGWSFACEGYSYTYMNDLTFEEFEEDITRWENTVGELIGDCDTMIYPYGSEVDYTSDAAEFLREKGYRYMVGLWASDDYYSVNQTYLRQTRRAVTGYLLDNYPEYFSSIFDVSKVLDGKR